MKSTLIGLVALAGIGTGCITPTYSEGEWPTGMPPKAYYASIYNADKDNQKLQTFEEYMTWNLRFYKGYGVFGGWNGMMEKLVSTAPVKERALLGARLAFLGQMVSAEWCKANKVRRIDADMLKLWAHLFRKSQQKKLLCRMTEFVIDDVEAILSDKLAGTEIDGKRYKKVFRVSEVTTATH